VSKDPFKEVFKKFPREQQQALLETIEFAEKLFPHATRAIAWGMPTLKIGDDNLCHVMGFKNHNSFFPSSGAIASQLKSDLAKYQVSKGTIQFDMNKSFSKALLKKILILRLHQINESYPKKNGNHIQYYKNGGVACTGKYKGKAMHGDWKFYRMDGSIMRTGSFKDGKQTGTWVTFDAKGKKIKETKF
jgi:uncharacterized protein YdhG (YjbR/CyaY superfamily)